MLVLGNIVDSSLLAYGIVVRSIELCACCGVYHAGVTDLVWWPPGSPGVCLTIQVIVSGLLYVAYTVVVCSYRCSL